MIELKGLIRFKIIKEIKSIKIIREYEVDFKDFIMILMKKKKNLNFLILN